MIVLGPHRSSHWDLPFTAIACAVDAAAYDAMCAFSGAEPTDELEWRVMQKAWDAGYAAGQLDRSRHVVSPLIPAWARDSWSDGWDDGAEEAAYERAWGTANRPCARPRYLPPADIVAENEYFAVSMEGGFARIDSKCVAGGYGWLTIPPRSVSTIFAALAYSEYRLSQYLSDYTGSMSCLGLWRNDDDGRNWDGDDGRCGRNPPSVEFGELEFMADHPADGAIKFGAVEFESDQLRALQALHEPIKHVFASTDTPDSRAAAKGRVKQIAAEVSGPNFMPFDGFCYCCEADVTTALMPPVARQSITGCPLCGRSWCD